MRKIFLLIALICLTLSCKTTYKNSSIPAKQIETNKAESNTITKSSRPIGVRVNSHGIALDTDEDGIPDYRDKELLTEQKCFPVDSNGVGNCPNPPCCQFDLDIVEDFSCHLGSITIRFAHNSKVLTERTKLVLATFGEDLKANPECNVRIGVKGGVSKRFVDLSWNRLNAVTRYLVNEKGISEERIIFQLDMVDDPNAVVLSGTNEIRPDPVPAPHPLRQKNHQ